MKGIGALFLGLFFWLNFTNGHAGIKVGTVMFYPPFVTSANQGFDIEFIQLLCQRLQQDCEFVSMDFYQLFTSLKSGEIDIAVGGITTFPSKRGYIFSLPYLLSQAVFLVNAGSDIKSINDLMGKKIGVMKEKDNGGGVFYDYLMKHYSGEFQIILYNNMEDQITALSEGSIDAAFTHGSTAIYWEQNGSGRFKMLNKPIPIGNGIGIMSVSSNQALINEFNEEIMKLEKTPEYVNLYMSYFGDE